jgi:hypothetical protein
MPKLRKISFVFTYKFIELVDSNNKGEFFKTHIEKIAKKYLSKLNIESLYIYFEYPNFEISPRGIGKLNLKEFRTNALVEGYSTVKLKKLDTLEITYNNSDNVMDENPGNLFVKHMVMSAKHGQRRCIGFSDIISGVYEEILGVESLEISDYIKFFLDFSHIPVVNHLILNYEGINNKTVYTCMKGTFYVKDLNNVNEINEIKKYFKCNEYEFKTNYKSVYDILFDIQRKIHQNLS